jgi:multicomponent K+:H+ antiporter subunit A
VSLAVGATLILASLLSVVLHRERLIALVILGAVGLVVSLAFVKFSAPDLALTQLSVEIVTIVLLMLALYFLPQYTPRISAVWRKWRDGILAGLLGLGSAALALAVMTRETANLADYFVTQSVPGGGGTNVVNVILVDFRGFDTLGEIAVLALAGLGIFALLQQIKLYAPAEDSSGRAWALEANPFILQTFSRVLFPMMLMVAVFVFLRGHNLPGGGFIAGLIAALAIVLQNLANGIGWTAQRLRTDMHSWLAAGLLLAAGTGMVAMALGYPFLTSAHTHVHWPVVGGFELASAMFFDAGVFLVVVGATVMILVELGKLNRVDAPAPVLQGEV